MTRGVFTCGDPVTHDDPLVHSLTAENQPTPFTDHLAQIPKKGLEF